MIHVAALLALAAVQDPEVWKLEIQKLKAQLAAREAEVEELKKRIVAPPKNPPMLVPVAPAAAPAPAVTKERAVEDQVRAAERAAEQALRAATEERDRLMLESRREGMLRSSPRAIEAKVTAVSAEIGLVVLSAGRDAGVREGDAFTIHRGGEFVAKVVVDRVDRAWSAAKITLKKLEPQVADEAGNALFVAGPRAAAAAPPPDELRALRRELDEVRKQVRALSDTLVPAWQGPGVALEDAPEELRAHLGIARGVLVRRVREGSVAEKAGLRPNDLIPDLSEAQVVDALQAGKPLRLLRQGREVTTPR